jgi:hypothetical protein
MSVIHLQNPTVISNPPSSWATTATASLGTTLGTTSTNPTWITTTNTTNPNWITMPSTGTWTIPQSNVTWTADTILINPLKKLDYIVDFDIDDEDEKELLEVNIKSIKKNKMLFNCNYVGNRIQPYELIMKLIEKNIKITVKVEVSDILSIHYINFQFVEIINNLNFNNECDFSELKVKFKYDKIKHENYKLSTKELRMDKLKKIMEVKESESNNN